MENKMIYNFSKIVTQDRNSQKWHNYADDPIVSQMWIADMDFEVANEIKESLINRIQTPIFGYTNVPDSYYDSIQKWQLNEHQWVVEKDWIVPVSGVVTGINLVIQAFTTEGDKIVIQTPVYHSFFNCILNNNRVVVENPLEQYNDYYKIDFNHLECIFRKEKPKMMILCSPHNPVGKVFSKQELESICMLCSKYNVILVSDEIHQDIVFPGSSHYSVGRFKDYLENVIILVSASKSFNLAGFKVSNSIIPNKKMRELYTQKKKQNGPISLNILGLIACEAAYQFGKPWLKEVVNYIESNRDYALEFFKRYSNHFHIFTPSATYFLWIKGISDIFSKQTIADWFLNSAKIRGNKGEDFGRSNMDFIRLNIACRKETLVESLNRVESSLTKAM
ncbi:MAG: MalY/PatB family protein [Bacillota bacterium]|nr:MalY/PatB family protein [Bacillota bacterium]